MKYCIADLNWGVDSTGAGRTGGNRVLELTLAADAPKAAPPDAGDGAAAEDHSAGGPMNIIEAARAAAEAEAKRDAAKNMDRTASAEGGRPAGSQEGSAQESAEGQARRYLVLYQFQEYRRFYFSAESWFGRLMSDADIDAYDDMEAQAEWKFLYDADKGFPEDLPPELVQACRFLLFADRHYRQEEDLRYAASKFVEPYRGTPVDELKIPEETGPDEDQLPAAVPFDPEWISDVKTKGDDVGAGMHMAEAELCLKVRKTGKPVWLYESEMWDRLYEVRREPAIGHDEPDWPDAEASYTQKDMEKSPYRNYFHYLDELIGRL